MVDDKNQKTKTDDLMRRFGEENLAQIQGRDRPGIRDIVSEVGNTVQFVCSPNSIPADDPKHDDKIPVSLDQSGGGLNANDHAEAGSTIDTGNAKLSNKNVIKMSESVLYNKDTKMKVADRIQGDPKNSGSLNSSSEIPPGDEDSSLLADTESHPNPYS